MNTTLRNRFVSDGTATMSPGRMLVALYERLLADIDDASAAIARRRPDEAHEGLVHAQRIIEELHLALDTEAWPEGQQLAALYLFLHDRLVQANLRKDAAIVAECRGLIAPLAETWRQAHDHLQATIRPAAATGGAFEFGA